VSVGKPDLRVALSKSAYEGGERALMVDGRLARRACSALCLTARRMAAVQSRGDMRVRALSRAALPALAATAGLAAAVRLALGAGQVNYDSLYALVWGRELAHGHAPDYAAGVLPPTPHPLSTLTGVLLAPLGTHAEGGLLVLAFVALGALGWLAFATGRGLAGAGAGAAAAALVLTRDTTIFYGTLAYFDVAFAVLVLAALLVEVRRPRAGAPVLALLGVAGLWRPEAWVLSGAYALYLMVGMTGVRERAVVAALALAAPVLWLGFDLVLAGDPLFSLTYTQHAAETLDRARGPVAATKELPRALGQVVRPAAAVGALASLALALAYARRRAALLVATFAVSGAGTAAAVAAGTPLNARYLLLPGVLCLLLCALALGGWTQLPRGHRGRVVWQVVAAAVALLLVGTAPHELDRLRGAHDRVAFQSAVAGDARATALAAGCDRLTLQGGRPVPLLALALDRAPTQFAVARSRAPRGALVLAPADQRVVRDYLLVRRAPRPSLPLAARSAHWRLYGRCPSRG
jgi:hypothetical protein